MAFANDYPTEAAKRVQYELADEPAVDEPHRPAVARVVASRDYFQTLGARVLAVATIRRDIEALDRALGESAYAGDR